MDDEIIYVSSFYFLLLLLCFVWSIKILSGHESTLNYLIEYVILKLCGTNSHNCLTDLILF